MKRFIFSLFISLILLTSCVSGYSITSSSYDPQLVVRYDYSSLYYNGYPVDYYNGKYYYYCNNCWYVISNIHYHLIYKHPSRPHSYRYNSYKPIHKPSHKPVHKPVHKPNNNHNKKDYYRPSEHRYHNHNNHNINRNNHNTRPRPSGRPSTNRGSSRQR